MSHRLGRAIVMLVIPALSWAGVQAAGAVFNKGVSAAGAVSTASLAAPTSLAASGTVSVSLTWTATTSGFATGTRVLRGTVSGGPYSQIAQIAGLATASYTDSPATSGTYYYVIEAYYSGNGANWTSPNSNQASATVTVITASFVKNLGTASCGSFGLNTVTVPAGGVPVGHTVVMTATVKGGTITGTFTATDSGLNTYTVDADVTNGTTVRTVVLSSRLTTALAAGNTMGVLGPNASSTSMAAAELASVASGTRVDITGTKTGTGNPPSANLTTTGINDLLYAAVGQDTASVTYTEAASWNTQANQTPACGAGSANHSAYEIASTAGAYTYSPTTSNGGNWAEAIVAYKAG